MNKIHFYKEYIIIDGKIIVHNGKEIAKIQPYTDEAINVLTVENLSMYLNNRLNRDCMLLENKKDERVSRLDDYKKISAISATTAVAASVVAFPFIGISNDILSTFVGNVPLWAMYFSSIIPASLVVSQSISLINLSYRPSKKSINVLEETIAYEKSELLKIQDKLNELNSITSISKMPENIYEPQQIMYTTELKKLRDAINLRSSYAANKNHYKKAYEKGDLTDILSAVVKDKNVVADFIAFLDNEYANEQNDKITLKKDLKA